MKRVQRVQARQQAAEAALAVATAAAGRQQAQVRDFARAAYMSGGPISSFATVLTVGGPSRILGGAALLGQVSQSQRSVLDALATAQQRQAAAAAKADHAARVAARVAKQVDRDRRSALVAMANQQSLLQTLSDAQAEVTKTVAKQESHVAALAKQQRAAELASIAEQRAALAAAWQTMQDVGNSMPWATKKQGREVVQWAKSQLGVPYSWAGGDALGPTLGRINENGNASGLVTRGFDCSGLALYAWAHVGFTLDHYTGYQWVEGHQIPLSKLRAGDLVFFATDVSDPLTIHHVGIYVHGNKMIDAPHTGAVVRYDEVFVPGLIGAVRP
jgi:cell wall-associated NlpC family hydrolase